MTLQLKKISNVGSHHPIVARLTIGIYDLLNFADIDENIKDQVIDECFEIHRCLLKAEQEALPVINEIKKIEESLMLEGVKIQGIAIHTPNVDSLDQARSFFKYSKQALQHTAKAVGILLNQEFKGPHFHKIHETIKVKFGADHSLTKLLEDDLSWLKELIAIRNEDEHPSSNKRFMTDFDIKSKEGGGFVITPPLFFNRTTVRNRLEIYSHNIFTFSEELIAHIIETFFNGPFKLSEIPEEKRDPKTPIRYQVVLLT